MRLRVLGGIAAPLVLAAVATAQCSYPFRNAAFEGGLDLTGTLFEGVGAYCTGGGPPVWLLYLNARDDPSQVSCHEWLLGTDADLGLPGASRARWAFVHADWADVSRCGGSRTAIVADFPDDAREGTTEHQGFYAIALAPEAAPCFGGDMDGIDDAFGARGNLVPVQPIPPPVLLSAVTAFAGVGSVRVGLDEAPQYGYFGPGNPNLRPQLLEGYRLYYDLDVPEPTGSFPWDFDGEVLDPATGRPLGVIPRGTPSVTVAFPWSNNIQVSIATRLVYSSANGVESDVLSAHRRAKQFLPYPVEPSGVAVAKSFTPTEVVPGEPVRLTISVRGSASTVRIWDHLGEELLPGCVDLASVTGLSCPQCDSLSYDAATGTLRATAPTIPLGGAVTIMLDLVAGPGPATGTTCRNTAWATADRYRYVWSRASFANFGSTIALLRDDSLAPGFGAADRAPLFPLAVYLDPAPSLPYTDEPGLLSDTSRPLVFYGLTRPVVLRLTKDLTPGVDSVVVHP